MGSRRPSVATKARSDSGSSSRRAYVGMAASSTGASVLRRVLGGNVPSIARAARHRHRVPTRSLEEARIVIAGTRSKLDREGGFSAESFDKTRAKSARGAEPQGSPRRSRVGSTPILLPAPLRRTASGARQGNGKHDPSLIRP